MKFSLCRAAVLALLAVSGCGRHWDLGRPFAPLVVESPEIPEGPSRLAFADALRQLGGRVTEGASQVVRIRLDADCSCQTCNPNTVAHTERSSQDTIQLCKRWTIEPPPGLADNIFHELGHVLGQWDHLPCDGQMMSPSYGCRTEHAAYTALDKLWICAGTVGGVIGGACDE